MAARRWIMMGALVLFVAGAVGLAGTVLRPLSVKVAVQSTGVALGDPGGVPDPRPIIRSVDCGFPLGPGPEDVTVGGAFIDHPCAHAVGTRRAFAGGFAASMIIGAATAVLIERRRKTNPVLSPT